VLAWDEYRTEALTVTVPAYRGSGVLEKPGSDDDIVFDEKVEPFKISIHGVGPSSYIEDADGVDPSGVSGVKCNRSRESDVDVALGSLVTRTEPFPITHAPYFVSRDMARQSGVRGVPSRSSEGAKSGQASDY
jgi:hypothetical protein